MADKARLQVRTNLNPEAWSDVGEGAVGVSIPIVIESSALPGGAATSAKQDEIIAKLAKYETNAIDEASATVTYIGMEDADGVWVIKKIDTTSGNVFTYATVTNNPTLTTYSLAWAGRTTATYSAYGTAF